MKWIKAENQRWINLQVAATLYSCTTDSTDQKPWAVKVKIGEETITLKWSQSRQAADDYISQLLEEPCG